MKIEKSISHIEVVEIELSIPKSDVKTHDGYLARRNDDGKTTFVICLVDN